MGHHGTVVCEGVTGRCRGRAAPVVLWTVRDLSDPETAFLGHLCDSTFGFLFDPFLWVLWLSCCAVIEPVLES